MVAYFFLRVSLCILCIVLQASMAIDSPCSNSAVVRLPSICRSVTSPMLGTRATGRSASPYLSSASDKSSAIFLPPQRPAARRVELQLFRGRLESCSPRHQTDTSAGHILGSSIVHLHIGEGLHNIVYSADFKFGRTMMLDSAMAQFPRAETLIIESTYGGPDDIMPDREGVEGKLVSIVNETAEKNGKVLIPVPAVGRAQEIMLVLDAYMKNGALRELPIYIEGMVNEATAIHTAFPEYLVRDIKEQILHQDLNPFQSEYFHPVTHPGDREEIVAGGPCVIIATSGMLEGGPAIDYFRRLAPDPRNTLAYVSYQVDGTLGNRIKNGLKEVSLFGPDGKIEMVKCDMRVESIEGFSGHSDRNQLLGFIKRMMPKPTRIIVNHGERRKSELFAQNVNRIFGIKTVVPDVLESLRLR